MELLRRHAIGWLWVAVIFLGVMLASGCTSALSFHARTSIAAAQAHRAACDVVEARVVTELDACTTERCVDETEARHRTAATACDVAGISLRSYQAAIGVAAAAQSEDGAMPYVLDRAASFVQAWMDFLSEMYRAHISVPNASAVTPLRSEVTRGRD